MTERLVDVLNERNTVLHVFPLPADQKSDRDLEQEAVKIASEMELVPKPECERLHARIHVSRGGPLTPYADALIIKQQQQQERLEHRIRERAYFLWQQHGCQNGQQDAYWHQARELEKAVP